jgi:hypothetical protein
MIKANKLTEENLAKQNFDLETPGRLDRPLQAVRPPLPEKLSAGQTPTSSRPISRITPRIAAKLQEKLGYLLGNLYLNGIDLNRSQSRGIEEIASLGQELAQLEKSPNRVRFKRDLGAKSPAKEAQDPHTRHPPKNPRNHSQNTANKELRKSPQRRTEKPP